ncbi:MAG: hypothetical protein ACREIC_01850, partial [Limisphaerales bacterium]
MERIICGLLIVSLMGQAVCRGAGLPARVNPSTLGCMIADVRHFLESGPFEPFVIVSSSGNRYRVPSADHATINPQGSRVVVWFDDESGVIIS